MLSIPVPADPGDSAARHRLSRHARHADGAGDARDDHPAPGHVPRDRRHPRHADLPPGLPAAQSGREEGSLGRHEEGHGRADEGHMSLLVASVAIPRPVRRLFTYSIPEALAPRCLSGVRVIVPFGRRKLTGYLLEVRQSDESGEAKFPLKPIEDVLDPEPVLDDGVLELARFAADYYVASLGEMIRSALPGMKAHLEKVVSITDAGRGVLSAAGGVLSGESLPRVASDPRAREILGIVSEFTSERGAAIRLTDLKRRAGPIFKARVLERL